MKKILILVIGLVLVSGCVNIVKEKSEQLNKEINILEEFEKNEWVRVIVRLKDNSKIEIQGTKEERVILSRQKDEWFKQPIIEVLATLSEEDFELIGKSSDGFDGKITKQGFNKLINDERVEAIYKDVMVGGFA